MTSEILNVKEIAKYLQLDGQTIYRKVKRGTMPFIRVDGTIRFRKTDIDNWLTKKTKGATK